MRSCGGWVGDDARRCSHCGRTLGATKRQRARTVIAVLLFVVLGLGVYSHEQTVRDARCDASSCSR